MTCVGVCGLYGYVTYCHSFLIFPVRGYGKACLHGFTSLSSAL